MTQYIILDTDAFSTLAMQRPRADSYAAVLVGKVPALTFTSVGEVYFGAYKANWGTSRVSKIEAAMRMCVVLPYDENLPKIWADLKRAAHRSGHPLGQSTHSNDLWIAACAVYYDAPLLTGNARHFRDLAPNLLLIDGS
ncbi:MAG: PIN domain-containing protein [Saccharothrix sp.]|nr:PIN domain-containing protein [Saccharothrix sp.]